MLASAVRMSDYRLPKKKGKKKRSLCVFKSLSTDAMALGQLLKYVHLNAVRVFDILSANKRLCKAPLHLAIVLTWLMLAGVPFKL